jgi:hypothetical protein
MVWWFLDGVYCKSDLSSDMSMVLMVQPEFYNVSHSNSDYE